MSSILTSQEASSASPALRGDKLMMRLGAALVAPRAALATAGRGTGSSDLGILVLATVAAVHMRELFTAGWLFVEGEVRAGLSSLVGVLARDLSTPLVLLLGASLVLTAFAGRRRNPSEDFDLACVAFVPLVTLELGLELLQRAWPQVPGWLFSGVAMLGYGWTIALLVLAWLETRRRPSRA